MSATKTFNNPQYTHIQNDVQTLHKKCNGIQRGQEIDRTRDRLADAYLQASRYAGRQGAREEVKKKGEGQRQRKRQREIEREKERREREKRRQRRQRDRDR